MNLFLILLLGLGAGALLLARAARRRAQGELLRRTGPRARAIEAGEAPAAAPSATVAAAPVPRALEAEAPATPTEIAEPDPVNRRKHPRIRSDQTFVITPFAGRAIMAQCRDLSTGGMRFGVVGCTLRAGDLVRVTFNIGDETVAAIGSVRRVQDLDPITSDVSLEFVRLDPWASQLLEQALEAEA